MGKRLHRINLDAEAWKVAAGAFHTCAIKMIRKDNQAHGEFRNRIFNLVSENNDFEHGPDSVVCWGDAFDERIGYDKSVEQAFQADDEIGDQPWDMGSRMRSAELILSDPQKKLQNEEEKTRKKLKVFHISAGLLHGCAVLCYDEKCKPGWISCWGKGTRITTEHNDDNGPGSPQSLLGLRHQSNKGAFALFGENVGIKKLVSGFWHNCVLLDNQKVWCWGTHGSDGSSGSNEAYENNLGMQRDAELIPEGCYEDKKENRDLPEKIVLYHSNTPEECVAQCCERGFLYAGVQYGFDCFCGDEPGSHGRLDEDACTGKDAKNCAGDSTRKCGGNNINMVYKVPQECSKFTALRQLVPEIADTFKVEDITELAVFAIEGVGKDDLIAAGRDITCVVVDQPERQKLRCWGDAFRQFKAKQNTSNTTKSLDDEGDTKINGYEFEKGVEVTALEGYACQICAAWKNKVRCWEFAGEEGCLSSSDTDKDSEGYILDPGEVKSWVLTFGGNDDKVTSLSIGDFHKCVVINGIKIACVGLNTSGELGRGKSDREFNRKRQDPPHPIKLDGEVLVDLGIEQDTVNEQDTWDNKMLVLLSSVLGLAIALIFPVWETVMMLLIGLFPTLWLLMGKLRKRLLILTSRSELPLSDMQRPSNADLPKS
ncbi:unnamed protein product [Chrysoparadoxa australica]